MQDGALWTVHTAFICMFGIKKTCLLYIVCLCLQGGYYWPNKSTVLGLV